MIPHVKRPALAMLAGALWLTAVDPAWAGPPSGSREQFVSLVANRRNLALVHQLQHQLSQISQIDRRLARQESALLGGVTNQSFNPLLIQLNYLDQQFLQQSARINQRLQNLNSLVGNPAYNQKAVDRLRNELTRLDVSTQKAINSIQRVERGSATPFAPGGF
jgi:hypothetical protein